jgi:acetolactate synthase-1/2/3 large subunit
MAMNELATMRNNNVDLRILLVRNRFLGLVREYQYYNYDSHYEGVKLSDWPDYSKIAEAYGLKYCECASNEELDEKLDAFLATKGACLMVCDVDGTDIVK